MTVQELKEALNDLDQNAEVRFAPQGHWPMEYIIDDIDIGDNGVAYLKDGDNVFMTLQEEASYEQENY